MKIQEGERTPVSHFDWLDLFQYQVLRWKRSTQEGNIFFELSKSQRDKLDESFAF